VVSTAALLTVSNNASIVAQPINVTVCSGSAAQFAVIANGAGLTYQWQVSTNGGTSFTNVNGETNSTLNINAVANNQNGNQYQVLVGSSCSANLLTSATAILNVSAQTSITTQPQDSRVCNGSNASFTATATGDAITYQWQLSTDGGTTFTNINGETASSLSLNNTTSSMNNNKYRVLIQSAFCGSSSSNAGTLFVSQPASISIQPQDFSACSGSTASVSVTATGTSLSYQWSKSTDGGTTFSNISGANNSTYSFVANSNDNGNIYRVNVTEATCGALVSSSALLIVNLSPVVTITATPSNVLLPGQTIQLNASSNPASNSFIWFKNGNNIAGQNGSSISITANGSGTYTASVTDANNCTGTSNAIVIRDSLPSNSFIYPNPNNGAFKVTVPNSVNNSNLNITMYDSKGSRVYQKVYAYVTGAVLQVNIKTLSGGIYAVVLSDKDGNIIRTGKVFID
jgi:hypothetical protein